MKPNQLVWTGIVIIILSVTAGFMPNPIDFKTDVTVEVQRREGIYLVFPRQIPTFEYEYVKTIEVSGVVKNWKASTLIDKMISTYKKEGIVGDAILFTEDDLWKAEVIRFKGEKPSKVTVEPEKRQGIYIIYPQQKTTFDYEYVNTIDAGNVIENWRASTLIEKILQVFEKKGVNADAVIFTEVDLWKADCVNIKK
ncbi:MAG: hypothetical protein C0424_07440 [Sphingobacteriaceae bacterium]|nr:hypothetical protein [Sphingobacteriaceae bacterium]